MGCGADQPHGLGVVFEVADGRLTGTVTLQDRHAGAPGIGHGGVVSAVIDEICGAVANATVGPAVTASLTTHFRRPAYLGRELTLVAWVEGRDERRTHVQATVHDGDTLVAEGGGAFATVTLEHFRQSGMPIPESWQKVFDARASAG